MELIILDYILFYYIKQSAVFFIKKMQTCQFNVLHINAFSLTEKKNVPAFYFFLFQLFSNLKLENNN